MIDKEQTNQDHVIIGIILIVASTFAMAFGDAIVKLVSSHLSVWQIFVARSVFAIPCLLILFLFSRSRLTPLEPLWVIIRSVLLVLTWLSYYSALPILSLSVAAVAMYANPIFTALLSAFLLKESVSKRQWLGVFIGFLGVIVILKPGTDAFSWALFLPILGAFFYSCAMILTRSKCQRENPITLALGLHLSLIISGLIGILILTSLSLDTKSIELFPFLLNTWPAMSQFDWGIMIVLGVLSAAFFLGVARAYQIAPPQIIGTFDYFYLVSAVIWGFVFFADTPDLLTIVGMILITTAGLFVASKKKDSVD